MKPFRYRLQTKLNIASREEQAAKEEMRQRIIQRDSIQTELDKIIDQQLDLEQSIIHLMQEDFYVDKFLLFNDYLPILKECRAIKLDELHKAEKQVESARTVLMRKTRETKTLSKLREKEWQLYLQELQKEEQQVIDEIAINNHYRTNLV